MGTVEGGPGEDGVHAGAGHYCPAQYALPENPRSPTQSTAYESGLPPVEATEDERAAILAMLTKRVQCAPGAPASSHSSAWARAAFRLTAIVMVIAGVGACLGD